MNQITSALAVLIFGFTLASCASQDSRPVATSPHALVLMTDFGVKDGAVSAMKGVAFETAPQVLVADLTHEIPPYNIWEAAYRLSQTYKYWPAGTVFVTVVDPGVGSERHSIILKSKSGHYFVGPDNGIYTLIEDESGIDSVRIIDESKQRLKGSNDSYTFHGRDLYVYVGARLAAGQLKFEDAGSADSKIVRLPYQKAEVSGAELRGIVPVLDPNYGNVWTNVSRTLVRSAFPDAKNLNVKISRNGKTAYQARLPLVDTFAGVPKGKPLLYFNSLLNLSFALNQGSFADSQKIGSGPEWTVTVAR